MAPYKFTVKTTGSVYMKKPAEVLSSLSPDFVLNASLYLIEEKGNEALKNSTISSAEFLSYDTTERTFFYCMLH